MKYKTWNSEKLLSLAALFVSLSTLIVFVYQTNLIYKQQNMSVYPHLGLFNSGSGSINYQYLLKNQGVGPALINSIEVTEKSGATYVSLVEYLEENLTEQDSIWLVNSDIYPGRLIPANAEITLFGLMGAEVTKRYDLPPNTLKGAKKLRELLNKEELIINITYSSIYDQSWSITNHTEVPIPQ